MKSQKSLSSLIFKARKVWSSRCFSSAGRSPLKSVIPEVTKELANLSHKLEGVIVGTVSLWMVRQKYLQARKKKSWLDFGGC